jgi:2,4-dienoyl-CoA reductase-like NADH-dependent reductase (Old Yellow Enzyme family)/thioredoxin reductase
VTELEHVFTPVALGPVELRNRIVSTAHQTTLVEDHFPTADFVAYHEARARGGVGLIVLEATAVHQSGLLTSHTLGGFFPEIVESYRRVAAAVQPAGARLFVQLLHGGREQIATPPRAPALGPSAVPSPRFRVEPRAAASQEIEDIVGGFGRAAALAAEAGLDGIEISAAHRYLVEQFFDASLNRRDDEWGDGARFLTEVMRAVRHAAPELCLGVRLSADSPRGLRIAEVATAEGADYLSLALGDSSTYLGSVGIVPPPPRTDARIAEAATALPTGLPRILTGRIADLEAADRLIGTGIADAVGMTRALIADPELAAKGQQDRTRIISCVGCNACIAHYHAATPLRCAVNPRTGRERTLDAARPSATVRRLVVVGGGPAGIAAAVEAGSSGHDVVIFERGSRLGGQIALAGAAPGNAVVAATFLDNAERQLAAAGVEVRLGTTVSADAARGADAVVVATGARPYRDETLELAGVEVTGSWDVLAGHVPDGERVTIADWGGDPSGLDAAEVLAAAGKSVTLVVASVAVGELVHQYRRNLYLRRLYRAGVAIEHHLRLDSAGDGIVRFRNVFARELVAELEADALVLAVGRVPEGSAAAMLAESGVSFEEAGDCLSPRSLEEAVLEGTLASRRALA